MERIVEEHAKGDPAAADDIRRNLTAEIGVDLSKVRPGSPESEILRKALVRRGHVVAVPGGRHRPGRRGVHQGAGACPPSASGAEIGIHPESEWNNPEPEVALAVNSRGDASSAHALGNDVNLRDFEGRSALLLSKAKDNSASCALGPFIRLFDDGLHAGRRAAGRHRVGGAKAKDGFRAAMASSTMRAISRDPLETGGAGHRRQLTSIPMVSCSSCGTHVRPDQAARGRRWRVHAQGR
jgi:fumarylacetoacetate (FAA) hydrolase family protein